MKFSEIELVAKKVDEYLPLGTAQLSSEYFYHSLPLCVIDAVFSIGVRYEGTRSVVARYCAYNQLPKLRKSMTDEYPARICQQSISNFCAQSEQKGPVFMADHVYKNKQRTSSRSGILKAEAALRFATVLKNFHVEYLQDVSIKTEDPGFAAAIRSIPGQGSGISLFYFWMLAGNENFIKPDRMVRRFLETVLSRPITIQEAATLIQQAVKILRPSFMSLTPRLLDHEIWKYQRSQGAS